MSRFVCAGLRLQADDPAQLIFGPMLTPVFGIGLLLVVPAVLKAFTLGTMDRHAMFYGSDPAGAAAAGTAASRPDMTPTNCLAAFANHLRTNFVRAYPNI
jgi:hypothetical protein